MSWEIYEVHYGPETSRYRAVRYDEEMKVIKQEKSFIKDGGKLIFPLPVFHIVDKDNYLRYLEEDFRTFLFV